MLRCTGGCIYLKIKCHCSRTKFCSWCPNVTCFYRLLIYGWWRSRDELKGLYTWHQMLFFLVWPFSDGLTNFVFFWLFVWFQEFSVDNLQQNTVASTFPLLIIYTFFYRPYMDNSNQMVVLLCKLQLLLQQDCCHVIYISLKK